MADLYALYRLALEGAWIQSSLDRTSLLLRKISASLGFRASTTRPRRTSLLWVLEHHSNWGDWHPIGGAEKRSPNGQRARLLRPGSQCISRGPGGGSRLALGSRIAAPRAEGAVRGWPLPLALGLRRARGRCRLRALFVQGAAPHSNTCLPKSVEADTNKGAPMSRPMSAVYKVHPLAVQFAT
jgi:hypothetical protein